MSTRDVPVVPEPGYLEPGYLDPGYQVPDAATPPIPGSQSRKCKISRPKTKPSRLKTRQLIGQFNHVTILLLFEHSADYFNRDHSKLT